MSSADTGILFPSLFIFFFMFVHRYISVPWMDSRLISCSSDMVPDAIQSGFKASSVL